MLVDTLEGRKYRPSHGKIRAAILHPSTLLGPSRDMHIPPEQTPLNEVTFSAFMQAHKFAAVHFWAKWNAYDTMMRRFIEAEIPRDLCERIAFFTFDIDLPGHGAVAEQHGLRNVPFFALYRDASLFRTVPVEREMDVIVPHLREMVYGQA